VAVAFGVAIAATVLVQQLPSSATEGGLAGAVPTAGLMAFHSAIGVMLILATLGVVFALQVPERPGTARAQPAPSAAAAVTGSATAD
jgi:cytochrome b561